MPSGSLEILPMESNRPLIPNCIYEMAATQHFPPKLASDAHIN